MWGIFNEVPWSLAPEPSFHDGDTVWVTVQDLLSSQGERLASTNLKSRCGLRFMSFSASARCWLVEDMVGEVWSLEMGFVFVFVVGE